MGAVRILLLKMKQYQPLFFIFCLCIFSVSSTKDETFRNLPIFQVVRFPNDPCTGDSTRNGTCYTAEECSNLGGTNTGSCAEGYGVCCTFTVGCGSTISQNSTYFAASDLADGACSARVCRCTTGVCQIRLDFQTFVISGPSTRTVSIGSIINGDLQQVGTAGLTSVTEAGQCLTDTFSISDQNTVPLICGTNSGEHVYFDVSDNCNNLQFQFGQTANGVTKVTRSFDIKISQINCNSEMLAPSGCTQWYTGAGPAHVRTFNYDGGSGQHLANQDQTICVRRESGNCAVCWVADAITDVQIGGIATASVMVKATACCGYGVAGVRVAASQAGYDCLMIPGATKAAFDGEVPVSQCGRNLGLATATATTGTGSTICTKDVPFRVRFVSDNWEYNNAGATAADEGGSTGVDDQAG